jgi:hypothetical protein
MLLYRLGQRLLHQHAAAPRLSIAVGSGAGLSALAPPGSHLLDSFCRVAEPTRLRACGCRARVRAACWLVAGARSSAPRTRANPADMESRGRRHVQSKLTKLAASKASPADTESLVTLLGLAGTSSRLERSGPPLLVSGDTADLLCSMEISEPSPAFHKLHVLYTRQVRCHRLSSSRTIGCGLATAWRCTQQCCYQSRCGLEGTTSDSQH